MKAESVIKGEMPQQEKQEPFVPPPVPDPQCQPGGYTDRSATKCAAWYAEGLCVDEDYCPRKKRRCNKARKRCARTCNCGPPPTPPPEPVCHCDKYRQSAGIRSKEVCAKHEAGEGIVCMPTDHSHPGEDSCPSGFTFREHARGVIACLDECVPPLCANCRSIALPCSAGANAPYKLLNYSSIRLAFDRLLASSVFDGSSAFASSVLEGLEEGALEVDGANLVRDAVEDYQWNGDRVWNWENWNWEAPVEIRNDQFIERAAPDIVDGGGENMAKSEVYTDQSDNDQPDQPGREFPVLTHPPLTCAPRPTLTPGGSTYCATHVNYFVRDRQQETVMDVLGFERLYALAQRELLRNRRRKLDLHKREPYIGPDSFTPENLQSPLVLQFLRSIAGLLFVAPATEVQCTAAAGDPYPAIGMSAWYDSPMSALLEQSDLPRAPSAANALRAGRRLKAEKGAPVAAEKKANPPLTQDGPEKAGPKPVEDKAEGRRLGQRDERGQLIGEVVDSVGDFQLPVINAPMPQCLDGMLVGTFGLDPIEVYGAMAPFVGQLTAMSIDSIKTEAGVPEFASIKNEDVVKADIYVAPLMNNLRILK